MTNAIWAYGSLLQMEDPAVPGIFATIAEVMDIGGPKMTRDAKDVTSHSSPDGFDEFIMTLKHSGEVTFQVNFNPVDPTHDYTTGLKARWDDGAFTHFKLILPDDGASEWTFGGYVQNLEFAENVADQLTADVTLKPSGAVVLTTP